MKTHSYLWDIKKICDNNHLTVDEIFLKLKNIYPKIGKSTVYRNVEELAKLWILTKLSWIKDKVLFELTKENHLHLIDVNTWKIKDIKLKDFNFPWIPDNFSLDFANINLYWKFR